MKPTLSSIFDLFFPVLTFCMLLSSCNKNKKAQYFIIDESASGMEWKGYHKDGSGNNGTIKVTGELIADAAGEITGGQISLPVSTLININLPSDELKNQLVHHLQSANFFNMAAHPQIGFRIISAIPDKILPGAYKAAGLLTLLGKTNPVNFPVKIILQGNKVEVTGEVSIDLTVWEMRYAGGDNVADSMYIKPIIDVQFRLVASKRSRLVHR